MVRNTLAPLDRNGKALGQFVYPIEPIPAVPGAGPASQNGLSEILAIDEHRFLALERIVVSGSGGVKSYARGARVGRQLRPVQGRPGHAVPRVRRRAAQVSTPYEKARPTLARLAELFQGSV
ncbi:esterase-like activity of phytase family protein [Crenobacter cavernae]|uniref:Phytase-like domain-containing protein n=1 Tax=Crenobacter cavernae TaxID=2290923 RepID=A0A345Y9B1_9NEIS|nr:esterase-like activity of phytase family protein [Crenobacter cavernae]AXK40513.1 hypothetical protein DWG20_14335 [Crenobacter cavernae]